MQSFRIPLVLFAVFLLTSCSSPEEQLISSFFSAVQGGDVDAVARVSRTVFKGGVDSWKIVEVGPESESAFTLPEIHEKLLKKRSEVRLQTESNAYYRQDNRSLYDEYQTKRAADPDQELTGELGKFHVEWQERLAAQKALEEEAARLASQASELKEIAGLSLNTSVNENFDGTVKAKELRLETLDGADARTYTFLLERYELVDTDRNLAPIARWIIVDIKEQA